MKRTFSSIIRPAMEWLLAMVVGLGAGQAAIGYDGSYEETPIQLASYHMPGDCQCAECAEAADCCGPWGWLDSLANPCSGTVFGGLDLLVVRPTFSEAIAFARVGAGPGGILLSESAPIDFDYEANFRTYVGYQLPSSDLTTTFTYTHIGADTNANGVAGGSTLVDPFGNFTVAPGDTISTRTEVSVNAFDWDVVAPVFSRSQFYTLTYNAGVRFADVDQSYVSQVNSLAGLSQGSYQVDFFGVGPRVGFKGYRHLREGMISLFAGVNGSLLVGTYDVQFTNLPAFGNIPGSQIERQRRTIPVLDTEIGVSVRPTQNIQLSAGYLVQAWWDLGASGGSFSNFVLPQPAFTGADDSNIMSFDGFFLRAEAAY